MKQEIERAAMRLKGKTLWRCVRAADMAMFDFGTSSTVVNSRGQAQLVGEFALHVQCAWRIAKEDHVIVGSQDLYFPADYTADQDIPEGFRWDKDPNRQDQLVSRLFENSSREFLVDEISVGIAGGLIVKLEEGLSLELFPATSIASEQWRLFKHGEHHLVVAGTGIIAGG
jgi:hypothetical protein